MKSHDRIVIVDGYSFIFRAYHAMPPLTRPGDGVPVGAVYGFTSMLMKLMLDMKPQQIVVVFDTGKKTYRNALCPNYKAHRPPVPEDLVPQFAVIRQAVDAFNVKALEREGFEADDVIATLARMANENDEKVLIVSADKDLMQLVNGNIKMYDAIRTKLIGEAEVKEKYGVSPAQMRDFLSLVGDTSDNIPGVPGIGVKTAAELLNEYSDIPGIFDHVEEIRQAKRRESLKNNKVQLDLSMKLVTLTYDVPLDVTLEDLRTRSIDSQKVLEFLRLQGFQSLVARVKNEFNVREAVGTLGDGRSFDWPATGSETNPPCWVASPPRGLAMTDGVAPKSVTNNAVDLGEVFAPSSVIASPLGGEATQHGGIPERLTVSPVAYSTVKSAEQLQAVSHEAELAGKVGIYLQNNFANNLEIKSWADVHSIGISSGSGKRYYVPMNAGGVNDERVRSFLLALIHNLAIRKIFYDYKSLLRLANAATFTTYFNGVDDVMLMSYSLGGGRGINSCEDLLLFYLEKADEIENEAEGGITGRRARLAAMGELEQATYVVSKADALLTAHAKLAEQLRHHSKQALYQRLDRPMSEIVYNMERAGLKLDKPVIEKLAAELDVEMKKVSIEIFKLAGHEFNIASPKQVGEVLFGEMKLQSGRKSSSGEYSTDVEALELLQASGHTIADFLIRWRQLNKLRTSYTDSLIAQVDERTGRIHSNFSVASTLTGRFSSTDPNLQNIPIRGEYGNLIRSAFVAKDGYKMLSADYSQIELRILAHIADVKALKAAFQGGVTDIHAVTASEIFGVPVDKVPGDLRSKAKAINFGIAYGMREHGLAKALGISRIEAAHYIRAYFNKYPEVAVYMDDIKRSAAEQGYVETIFGRRCWLPEINSKVAQVKAFAERAAINAPIQGTTADIMRRAMIELQDGVLATSDGSVTMLSQIHDELLFEIRDDDRLDETVSRIRKIMEGAAAALSVPVKVNCSVGRGW